MLVPRISRFTPLNQRSNYLIGGQVPEHMNTSTHMNTPITILGPTASGKTRLAALVANRKNGEIISADSRQVYRGMNLGTGKDYDDYIVDGQQIPYHLVDISEPGEEYNLFRYQQDFLKAFNNISSRNKTPLICGGTGLYLEAVLTGYKLTEAPKDETLRAFLASKTQDELNDFLASLRPLHLSLIHISEPTRPY